MYSTNFMSLASSKDDSSESKGGLPNASPRNKALIAGLIKGNLLKGNQWLIGLIGGAPLGSHDN